MINLTVCALSIANISHSPLFSPISSTMKSKQILQQVQAKNFFTSFLIDQSHFVSLVFSHSSFTNFLQSPITINNYNNLIPEVKIISKNFSTQLIKSDIIFTVIGCNFINCIAGDNKRGGAIHYQKDVSGCLVTVYSSTFENCKAYSGDGGAIFVCRSIGETNFESTHQPINFFNSSYCCYSKCTANGNDIKSGYGPVMFIFANSIEIYYSTVVECPAENEQSYGSQIDLKSSEIFSSYINSTKGKSTYCCAVEYRLTNRGKFKYQTFVDLTGGFLTSFTDLANNLDISFCNYVNDTLIKPSESDASFIYVKNCDVFISNFCFVGIKIPENPNEFQFIYQTNSQTKRSISLIDSFVEYNIKGYLDVVTLNNVEFYDDNNEKPTNKIDLLNLGPCQGNLTPPPTIFSDTFTPTLEFSVSNSFTDSKKFSKSDEFTYSSQFSSTGKFSSSWKFTKTGDFSQSEKFLKTSDFSSSKRFTFSSHFSKTSGFAPSDAFSNSKQFSRSNFFSKSDHFAKTSKFTDSKQFSNSNFFSKSDNFAKTSKFTDSKQFSSSNFFSKSDNFGKTSTFTDSRQFSHSNFFSKSDHFDQTSKFSKSGEFSPSHKFICSSVFTESNTFTASKSFSPSDSFTPSSHFTGSKKFSFSGKFSRSLEFTLSDVMYVDRGVNIGSSEKGGNAAVIAASVAAVAAAAIIAAVVIFFIIKKRRKIQTSDIDIMNETNNSVTVDNALQTIMDEDDPFAADFKNELKNI